jgi:2-polyprenyl-3-methyl-5-hydroxy-6-metoxy-1,4-benzoquinol methylase
VPELGTAEHPFDESYFVGGSRSNYQDYREVEPAIDRGFMPVVRRYAELCAHGRERPAFLDVGCAVGFYVERFAALGWEAHGVDISEWAVEEGRRRGVGNLAVGAATDLPHEDESFDFVTSIDVIEHLEPWDSQAMVHEIHRVLRPGGLAFVATPNFVSNRFWNVYTPGFVDRDATHINLLSVEELRAYFAAFARCEIYGDTPFVEQFHAWDESGAAAGRLLRLPRVNALARHVAWKLLGRSVEYSSYLHAVATK